MIVPYELHYNRKPNISAINLHNAVQENLLNFNYVVSKISGTMTLCYYALYMEMYILHHIIMYIHLHVA